MTSHEHELPGRRTIGRAHVDHVPAFPCPDPTQSQVARALQQRLESVDRELAALSERERKLDTERFELLRRRANALVERVTILSLQEPDQIASLVAGIRAGFESSHRGVSLEDAISEAFVHAGPSLRWTEVLAILIHKGIAVSPDDLQMALSRHPLLRDSGAGWWRLLAPVTTEVLVDVDGMHHKPSCSIAKNALNHGLGHVLARDTLTPRTPAADRPGPGGQRR